MAQSVLAYLIYLRYDTKPDLRQVLKVVSGLGGLTNHEQYLMTKLRKSHEYGQSGHELNELIEVFAKQLSQLEGGNFKDASLVDLIVQTLQLPNVKGVLGGKNLESLKKALLLPEELSNLRAGLESKETSCAGCSRTLVDHEMTTYFKGEGLYCYRCVAPRYASCSKCDTEVADISMSMKKLKRFVCKNHGVLATEPNQREGVTGVNPVEPTIPERFMTMRVAPPGPPATRRPPQFYTTVAAAAAVDQWFANPYINDPPTPRPAPRAVAFPTDEVGTVIPTHDEDGDF